jgi:hypothetical protein
VFRFNNFQFWAIASFLALIADTSISGIRVARERSVASRSRQAVQNAFAGSFIGRLRVELLKETLFRSFPPASLALGWMSPAIYRCGATVRCASLHRRLRSMDLQGMHNLTKTRIESGEAIARDVRCASAG